MATTSARKNSKRKKAAAQAQRAKARSEELKAREAQAEAQEAEETKDSASDAKGNSTKAEKASDSKKSESKKDKKEPLSADDERFMRVAKELESSQTLKSPTPLWYKVIMFSLLVVGILWIIVYYITSGLYPVPSIGGGNIGVGVGALMVSMLMMTRWR